MFDTFPGAERGACVTLPDPDVMHPDPADRATIAQAKATCAGCPVKAVCLEWALDTGQRWGVWGGLTESERGHSAGRRAIPARTAAARVVAKEYARAS